MLHTTLQHFIKTPALLMGSTQKQNPKPSLVSSCLFFGSQSTDGDQLEIRHHARTSKTILNPLTPHLRSPEELSVQTVAQKFLNQAASFTAADIQQVALLASPKNPEKALDALILMTQFGNMKSLNVLGNYMASLHRQNRSTLLNDETPGSLSSVMSYLSRKLCFPGIQLGLLSCWNNMNPGVSGSRISPGCLLVDSIALKQLKKDPDLQRSVLTKECRLIAPEGWQTGITPFNQISIPAMVEKLKKVITLAEKIQREDESGRGFQETSPAGGIRAIQCDSSSPASDSSLSWPQAVKEALHQPVYKALQEINPGLISKLEFLPGTSNPPTLTSPEEKCHFIAQQLSPPEMTPAMIQRVLEETSPEPTIQQAALEILDRFGEVFTPRRINQGVLKRHQFIQQYAQSLGVKPQNIFFVLPDLDSSFTVMASIYQQLTGVPASQFIDIKDSPIFPSRLQTEEHLFVALDDLVATGDTYMDVIRKLKDPIQNPKSHLLLTSIASTRDAAPYLKETSISFSPANPIEFAPDHWVETFSQTPYIANLTPIEKTLFQAITQGQDHGE
ncbi:MAG: hypothetical protein K2X66_16280, partial [Cyanobacteria bacterium]|nr:hypothetical protein [Cyanobacteriota bacterium]